MLRAETGTMLSDDVTLIREEEHCRSSGGSSLDLPAVDPRILMYNMGGVLSAAPNATGTSLEATSRLPCTAKFQGINGFLVVFDEKDHASWNFSDSQNKIYAKRLVNVPFKFVTRNEMEPGKKVRALLVYKSTSTNKNVERCTKHEAPRDESNRDFEHTKHIVRCGDDRAEYCVDQVTGRYSVVVPLDPPQAGTYSSTILYSFGCLNSCLNRQPTQIVFTLEDAWGKVCGRDVVNVQVCASPKRDKEAAETTTDGKCARKRKSAAPPVPAKQVKPEAATEHFAVAVLDEAEREAVARLAYGRLLAQIDLEERLATAPELRMFAYYKQLLPKDSLTTRRPPQ